MSRPQDLNAPSIWNMRIWDEQNKEWLGQNDPEGLTYYGFDIRYGETVCFGGLDWLYKRIDAGESYIWEHSTGIKDKNGVEIYEGDLVKWLTGLGEYIYFVVEWLPDQARFCLRNQCSLYDYENINTKKTPYLIVVGDVHENSELIMRNSTELRKKENKVSKYKVVARASGKECLTWADEATLEITKEHLKRKGYSDIRVEEED